MTLSVVIVNFNGFRLTHDCVASLRAHPPSIEYEIIVVDNGSSNEEGARLQKELSDCRVVINGVNKGFGAANNMGVSLAKGEFVFFLNNDTLLDSDVATPLVNVLRGDKRIGIVGPTIRNTDGSLQMSFGSFPSVLNEWKTRRMAGSIRKGLEEFSPSDQEWVTGAAMMIRRDLFQRLGGFDESYFMYFEDVDLCLRVRQAGYRISYLKDHSLVHLGGRSYVPGTPAIELEYRRSQLRFYDRFRGISQRLLLRLYLLMKYGVRLGGADGRKAAAGVLGFLWRRQGERYGKRVFDHGTNND